MVEREWREATDLKPARVWLLAVLVVAAALRFWGIEVGLDGAVRAEEAALADRVVRMMTSGDLNPHDFETPSLYLYLQLPVASVRFMAGAVAGRWSGLAQVGPGDFVLSARIVIALFGLATVWLTHQIGMRWGARHALLAAGLVAVTPLHVRAAHAGVPAMLLAFFVALAFLLSLNAAERGTSKTFAWAGGAAGLAMATDYTGASALLLPLLAAWMTHPARPSRLACAFVALGSAALAFLAAVPFAVLDLPAFLDGFARAVGPRAETARGWVGYLSLLEASLKWPATVILAAGFALGAVRAVKGPGHVRWTLLVVFPVFFLWRISGDADASSLALLPAIAFASVLIANAVVSGVSLLRRFSIPRAPRTALIVALTVAALLPPLLASIRLVRALRAPAPPSAGSLRLDDAHVAAPSQPRDPV